MKEKESNNPIVARIIAKTDVNPTVLASHAALKCYQAQTPVMGKKIDVENRLFGVGHHTTLQHYFSTADIENIAVGDITAGIHLVSPFYTVTNGVGVIVPRCF